MSDRIVKEVLEWAPVDLKPLELLVLVSLAEEAREGDRLARFNTSADKLADRVRSTPASVRNTLGRLRQRGLIVPVHEKAHRGLAQQYTITKMNGHTRRATWE